MGRNELTTDQLAAIRLLGARAADLDQGATVAGETERLCGSKGDLLDALAALTEAVESSVKVLFPDKPASDDSEDAA